VSGSSVRMEVPASCERHPSLGQKVQNYCNHYSRMELDNHDRLDDLT